MGIGMDVKYPLHEAMALLTPPTTDLAHGRSSQGPAQGWLFHLDSRNVTATSWTPLVAGGRDARAFACDCWRRAAGPSTPG